MNMTKRRQQVERNARQNDWTYRERLRLVLLRWLVARGIINEGRHT